MPMPPKNSFGYSFWLYSIAAGLLIGSFVCNLLSGTFRVLLNLNPEVAEKVAEDMMMGRLASRYEDSGQIR